MRRKHNLISKGTYSYISKGYKVFLKEGRSELERHLEAASESKSSIITVPPYSFIIGKHSGSWFALDTHVINKDPGGNGNGLLKVFGDPHLVARWAWKRLAASGVKSGYLELVEISFSKRSELSTNPILNIPEESFVVKEKVEEENILYSGGINDFDSSLEIPSCKSSLVV